MHSLSRWSALKDWTETRSWQSFQSKGPYVLFGIYAVILHARAQATLCIPMVLAALSVLWGMVSIAYLIHDKYDKGCDQHAHKSNFFLLPLSFTTQAGYTLLCISALVVPWIYLAHNTTTYLLFGLHIALVLTYSCPPCRFKRHLILAPLWDALYAYVLPVFTATYVLGLSIGSLLPPHWMGCISLWMLLLGLRHYINHIALDAQADKPIQHRTMATQYGHERLRVLNARYLLPAEMICLGVCLWLMRPIANPTSSIMMSSIGLLLTGYYFWQGIGTPTAYRFTYIPWDRCTRSLPLVLITLLTLAQPLYISLLVLHVFLFYPNTAPRHAYQLLHSLTAKGVNYGIYYFRRYLMRQSQQQIRKEHYTTYLVKKERIHKKKRKGCVAIANFHKEKYTETFVWGPLRQLRQGVHFLYGDPIPRYRDEGVSLRGSFWRRSDEDALVRFFIQKRIQAVLAHFGPLGVHMLPACQAAALPLMVYFHGYDVFNRRTINEYKARYVALFRYASRLLCASRAIQHQLRQWGAHADKLFYMPPYVHVALFPYRDHAACPPHFLFVGRFCETKRPHLILLAFRELLIRFPEARLTMIGQGGGGALFESSVILAHTLGIHHRVHFHGIGTHKEVAYAMQNSRALLVPSWQSPLSGDCEGTPVAALEAAAAGLPVITTPHAGLKEVFQNEDTALIVPPDDPKAWAHAMRRLTTDDALVKRIAQAAAYSLRPLIEQHTTRLNEHFQMAIQPN